MATHNIFLGGQRTRSASYYEMLPSTDVAPNSPMTPATHKEAAAHSVTRHLAWLDDDERFHTGNATGSPALENFLQREVVAAGDVLNIAIIPRHHSLLKVWWQVIKPLTGFTFSLQVRGNAQSLGGTTAVPVVKVLAINIDGAMEPTDSESKNTPSGLIGISPAAQGDPLAEGMYFDQNDMLQLVVNTLPPEGIACSEIRISPVFESYCEGSW